MSNTLPSLPLLAFFSDDLHFIQASSEQSSSSSMCHVVQHARRADRHSYEDVGITY